MPEASATPSRSGSGPDSSNPASVQASRAAISANWLERSSRRALTRSSTSVGSTATMAAICTGRVSAQS